MPGAKDQAFIGELILSFQTALLLPVPGSVFQEPSVGFIFLLISGESRVVKFSASLLKNFCQDVKHTLAKYPDADQRDNLENLLEGGQDLESLSQHPIVLYLQNVPNVPAETRRAMAHQYVKLIHTNAYSDLFKFDITFADESSSRLSMASSVVVYFLEALEDSCSDIKAMEKPH